MKFLNANKLQTRIFEDFQHFEVPDCLSNLWTTNTDDNGFYSFAFLPDDRLFKTIIIAKISVTPTYELEAHLDPSKDKIFTIPEPGKLRVKFPGADPLALKGEVLRFSTFVKNADDSQTFRYFSSRRVVHTGQEEIEFEGLAPGIGSVAQINPNSKGLVLTDNSLSAFRITAGETTEYDLLVEKGVLVRGRVVDALTKKGVSNVFVRLMCKNAKKDESELFEAKTGVDGVFTRYVKQFKSGSISIWPVCGDPGYVYQTMADEELVVAVSSSKEMHVPDIQIWPALKLNGKVLDANGNAVRHALVYTRNTELGFNYNRPMTDDEGRFQLIDLKQGMVELLVRSSKAVNPRTFKVDLNQVQQELPVKLDSSSSVFVWGRLIDKNGKPLVNIPLEVESMPEDEKIEKWRVPAISFKLNTDEQGRFAGGPFWPDRKYSLHWESNVPCPGFTSQIFTGRAGAKLDFGDITCSPQLNEK